MVIGINLLAINKDIGGAYNYIDNLLTSLDRLERPYKIKIFHTIHNNDLVYKYNNFELISCGVNSTNRIYRIIYENTILHYLLNKHKVNIVIWPSETIGFIKILPTIVISHDFLPLIRPKVFGFFRSIYLRLAIKFAINKADYFYFISHTTQNELLQIIPDFDLNKSTILPNIINNNFRKLNINELENIKTHFPLPLNYFLYVAHYYPHKNHKRLISSFSKYKDASLSSNLKYFKLVLRGDGLEESNEIKELVNKFSLHNDIVFAPKCSQLELIKLYNMASALVFPSIYEGGGIPIMEALACGCQIIASNIDAVKEFTGDVYFGFDPYCEESITKALFNFTNNFNGSKSLSIENHNKIIQIHREFNVVNSFYDGIEFLHDKFK